jgi:hypothetical protein
LEGKQEEGRGEGGVGVVKSVRRSCGLITIMCCIMREGCLSVCGQRKREREREREKERERERERQINVRGENNASECVSF